MTELLAVGLERPQYRRHAAPIVAELERRGHDVIEAAETPPWSKLKLETPTIVTSWADAVRVDGPVIYVEHGAGQTYKGVNRGTPGAVGLDHVVLFVCPSERVADAWRNRYPRTPAVAVGCPALDWHSGGDGRLPTPFLRAMRFMDSALPTVAITSHWQNEQVAEQRPALPLFMQAISDQLCSRFRVLGHGHPRDTHAAARWAIYGVEFEPDPDAVLRRADVLVADNTSLQAEAAALDIPLVFLNAPWYRRSVDHGARFWDWPRGQVSCNEPDEVGWAVDLALRDEPSARAGRHAMALSTYVAVDGRAASRAADAIERAL